MIGEKMRNAINQQIKHELESSYLYLAMEAYFRGDMRAAVDGFRGTTAQAPRDTAGALMLASAEALLARGVPDDWDGVDKLLEK